MISPTARRRIAELAMLAALCAGVALAGAALFATFDLARAQDGGAVGGQVENPPTPTGTPTPTWTPTPTPTPTPTATPTPAPSSSTRFTLTRRPNRVKALARMGTKWHVGGYSQNLVYVYSNSGAFEELLVSPHGVRGLANDGTASYKGFKRLR